MINSMKLPI